jgi:hypothetical protein
MSGPRSFGPDELEGVAGLRPDELAAETRLARELEGLAARDGITPATGFTDRVMAALAAEPGPAPAVAAGSALRHARLAGLLVSVRDAFRVTLSGGFPVAVRAQAFALVLLVAGITAGSGVAAAGALGLLGERATPSPSTEVPSQPAETPAPSATPEATPMPSASPEPSGSPEASESAEPSETPEPSETAEATRRPAGSPKATDDHDDDDGDSSGKGSGGEKTDDPDETPDSDDD